AIELFADEQRGGFYLTAVDAERLVARTKDFDDHPTPSGNSMLASVLLRLGRIYGADELERRAVGVFRLLHGGLTRAPGAFAWTLCAVDQHLAPPRELAILGPVDSTVARAALARFDPNAVVAVASRIELVRPSSGRRARPRVLLFVLGLAAMSYSLQQGTIAPVLPTIEHQLQVNESVGTWVQSSYLLSTAVLTPIFGRLGDIH